MVPSISSAVKGDCTPIINISGFAGWIISSFASVRDTSSPSSYKTRYVDCFRPLTPDWMRTVFPSDNDSFFIVCCSNGTTDSITINSSVTRVIKISSPPDNVVVSGGVTLSRGLMAMLRSRRS